MLFKWSSIIFLFLFISSIAYSEPDQPIYSIDIGTHTNATYDNFIEEIYINKRNAVGRGIFAPLNRAFDLGWRLGVSRMITENQESNGFFDMSFSLSLKNIKTAYFTLGNNTGMNSIYLEENSYLLI